MRASRSARTPRATNQRFVSAPYFSFAAAKDSSSAAESAAFAAFSSSSVIGCHSSTGSLAGAGGGAGAGETS